ncbi:hypothetical protein VVT58_17610 (plasmid) [Sphingobium sp. SJ10-10]|uniref:hypothetical protein n=1 Tax=Sphingobium sp. SJ10-10 TaxID=3114999 RepID=UPI002E197F25|nr:hypothetical protein [Sphingobium sp. SJ10-10]
MSWYEHLAAKIGLRIAGLILLISAWPEGGLLRKLVMENPTADMNATELLLAALLFLSASGGAALTAMGSRLWEPVKLSARWSGHDRNQRARS